LQNDGPQLVINAVDDGSPAAKCGLKPGDVVTAVGSSPVARALDFERALLGHKAGEELEVTLQRDRKNVNVNLVLAQLPKSRMTPTDRAWDIIGLKLEPIAARQFKETQSRYRGGLKVVGVRPGSPAAKQNIQRGDVLVGMHVWETVSLENVSYILNRPDFAEIEPVKFYILRGEQTLFGHLSVGSVQR
jgi:serine protease Do